MRRVLATAALAVAASFAFTGVSLASDPDPVVPPAFAPPAPAPVVDADSASAFAKLYVARNARNLLNQSGVGTFERRRVRAIDANAACLQHPVITTRFGCVFTLRALVIQNRHRGWDDWDRPVATPTSRSRGGKRFRIRNYGCLGALTINGGPTATPTAQVRFVECARVSRDDLVAPEPTS